MESLSIIAVETAPSIDNVQMRVLKDDVTAGIISRIATDQLCTFMLPDSQKCLIYKSGEEKTLKTGNQ
mgnify:CR=1 FL=1